MRSLMQTHPRPTAVFCGSDILAVGAVKHCSADGISVPNAPGTIDSDYRGELKVIMINHGAAAFEILRGDRIAQLVLAPVTHATWLKVDELDETERGEGGFGSTGGVVSLGN